MPKIFLKHKSPEFAAEEEQVSTRSCDMPGCPGSGDHRAPKNRGLNDYYHFCLDHVREYNQAWNFFSGMSNYEVEDHMYRSMYGDRPTWRYDVNGSAEDALRRAASQTRDNTEHEQPKAKNAKLGANTPEGEAMAIMGLEPPVTLEDIKARYKILAKKHHPDLNQGCSKSEELLKTINMAYTILKVAYEHYKKLPDRN